ncbi:MAG: hypothetical protein ACM3O3_01515, partial [Syntrophothermus sp.]
MFLTKISRSPFYQVVIKSNGKRTNISTGTSNYNEALLFMAKLLNGEQPIKKISAPVVESPAAAPSIKLSSFQSEYLNFISSNKSKSYIRSVNLSFKHFIAFAGDIFLSSVDVKLIDQFISFVSAR